MKSEHNKKNSRVIVIGAGMAGILAAIKLREAGYENFNIYEKADRVGGTWRENQYPGLACDVPAHLYSYDFAPNPNWSQMFAPGDEIFQYFQNVATKFNVLPSIRFNEMVTECVFRDGSWHIETSIGRKDVAQYIIAATGVLHHPNIPEFDGIESFQGKCFHSARWDHSAQLDGQRIGVIGTGSTAVQMTSALSKRAGLFKLFQRTAQWIMPMDNPQYSADERRAFAEDPAVLEKLRAKFDRIMTETISNAVIDADSELMANVEKACAENLSQNVENLELRKALTPNYRAGCKRLVFSTDFYEAIQHPHAELVTSGITQFEPTGIRTIDGELHELDVVVLATGFHPDRFIRPTSVLGLNGASLDSAWKDRPIAYMSVSIPEFPNFFMVNGPNSPIGNFSLIRISEFQLGYILQLMREVGENKARAIAATSSAMADFDEARIRAAKSSIWTTGCNSWYLDKAGVPMSWPWSYNQFAEAMAKPDFSAFQLLN